MSVVVVQRHDPDRPFPASSGAGGWRWPAIVVGLLFGHVALMMWAVYMATGDRDGVVIPNSYARSLEWDRRKAEREWVAANGWRMEFAVLPGSAGVRGTRRVSLKVLDGGGGLLPAEKARVMVYHEARPALRHEVTLTARTPGEFDAELPMGFRGYYRVEVRAETPGGVFVGEERPFVVDGPVVEKGGRP